MGCQLSFDHKILKKFQDFNNKKPMHPIPLEVQCLALSKYVYMQVWGWWRGQKKF